MNITGSDALAHALSAFADPKPPLIYSGIEIHSNPLFPMIIPCDPCGRTGDGGALATYCPHCKGQGETKVIGVAANGRQTLVIREPLPKKFPIRFPVPVPLREVRRCNP